VPATRSISKCVRGTHGLRALRVLGVLCGSYALAAGCWAADIRTWAFEATIIHKDDPPALLSDVRLGDPVVGTFSYDVSLPMDSFSNPPQWADYTHPFWFQGLRMAIENPRSGEELRWGREADDYGDWFVSVFKESPYYEPGTSAVAFWSTTEPPPRPGVSSTVYMVFAGPSVLTEISLPTAYNLDDWPRAAIYFAIDNINPFDAAIAQIHTITPVAPGDFTLDGKVDVEDYSLWRGTYGPTGISEADWNRDGSVDTADYVVWRKNAGTVSVSNSLSTVPEPNRATLLLPLLIVAIAARCKIGRSVKPALPLDCPLMRPTLR
jgi:hypothetical protein